MRGENLTEDYFAADDLFAVNPNVEITVDYVDDIPVIIMDDYYKNPKGVVEYFHKSPKLYKLQPRIWLSLPSLRIPLPPGVNTGPLPDHLLEKAKELYGVSLERAMFSSTFNYEIGNDQKFANPKTVFAPHIDSTHRIL